MHPRGAAADEAGATIINNLSAAAKQMFPHYYAYTSAKMGAWGLHRRCARRWRHAAFA